MATSAARKPLPALAFLLALSLLTALVWWRVLHRSDTTTKSQTQSSCTPSVTVSTVPAPQAITVTVLNSTDKQGLAASVGAAMTALGFKVGGVANDVSSRAPVAGVGEIRFGPLGKPAATLISYYLVGSTLVPDTRADAGVDVALGAKYTALATAPTVAKALAADHLTQLPPPAATTPAAASTSKAATTPAASTPAGSSSAPAGSTSAVATKSC
jgi:hypothetical protein